MKGENFLSGVREVKSSEMGQILMDILHCGVNDYTFS